jgi:hypothetical protein
MTNQALRLAPPQGEVTPSYVESMVSRIAATPILIEELGDLLTPQAFYKPEEQHLALFFRAIRSVYLQYHVLHYETVRAELEGLLCDSPLPAALHEALMAEPLGILRWTLLIGREQVAMAPIEQSREMIRKFLHERAVYVPLQQAIQQGVPANIQTVIDQAQQQWSRIGQLDTDPISSGIPDGRGSAPLVIRSTGVAFLDRYMDGGQAAGEAYGFLGPTGVGKTAQACAMAGAMLLQEAARLSANPAYVPQMVYYVTYEAGKDEIRQRVISAAADIARDTVKHIDFSCVGVPACFSSAARQDFKPYEAALELLPGVQRTGERERYLGIMPQLERYLRVIDLSGLGDSRYSRPGVGGLPELVGLLTMDQARLGNPGVAVVFVDYVLLAVERHLQDQGQDVTKHGRIAIPTFVDGARMQIAGRFNTSIWLLQQFNTAGNKKSPTSPMSIADASESGARFATNLSFCIGLGTKDLQSNCTLLWFLKRRRHGDMQTSRTLLIDPVFHRLVDVTEQYTVERTQGRIIPRGFASQIHGAVSGQHAAQPGHNPLTDGV